MNHDSSRRLQYLTRLGLIATMRIPLCVSTLHMMARMYFVCERAREDVKVVWSDGGRMNCLAAIGDILESE